MEKTGQSNRHILLKILLAVIMFAICFLITQFIEQRYAIRQEVQVISALTLSVIFT
jgi:hypothetical protein